MNLVIKSLPTVSPFYGRTGNEIPNQYIIHLNSELGDIKIFQSYESIIAVKTNNEVILTDKWDYSNTTGKYRNEFLNEKKLDTKYKIDKGIYLMLNTNRQINNEFINLYNNIRHSKHT